MRKNLIKGHLAALFTIFVWGTTYVSTKILLNNFSPIEILFIRIVIAIMILSIISPKMLKYNDIKEEIIFVAAGFCGVFLYFILENIALTYTSASNVGVILAIIPFFTAIIAHFIIKTGEKFNLNFFIGFIAAITGICLISFNGTKIELNPFGDFLTILAAFSWALYQVLIRKISMKGYNSMLVTKKVFIYGLLFIIPATCIFDFNPDYTKCKSFENLFNILFLGIFASALCFVTWTYALKRLGAIKTSVYGYVSPVITVITAIIVLKEPITLMSLTGTILTLSGLVISQKREKQI